MLKQPPGKRHPIVNVLVGVSLLKSSNTDVQQSANTLLKTCLSEALRTYDPANVSESVLCLILAFLRARDATQFGVSAETLGAFWGQLQRSFPYDACPPSLSPLIYGDHPSLVQQPSENQTLIRSLSHQLSVADLIAELGYSCTASPSAMLEVLSQLDPHALNPLAIARVVAMMVRTAEGHRDMATLQSSMLDLSMDRKDLTVPKDLQTWNTDAFVDALKTVNPELNWRSVAESLDEANCFVPNFSGLLLILRVYRRVGKGYFPVDTLTQVWRNTTAQLSILRLLVIPEHAQSPEIVAFLSSFTNRVVREGLKSLSNSADPTLQPWICLDLVKTLLQLGEANHHEDVCRLLDHPLKTFPEILMIALAQITLPKPNVIQERFLSYLMIVFLSPHPNTSVVLSKVFQLRQSLVLKGMVDWYNAERDPGRLHRVLDVAQDIKALPMLLTYADANFVLRLAMLAAKREFLNLERWLQDRVREHPAPFCQTLVSALQAYFRDVHTHNPGISMLPEHARIVLDVLSAAVPAASLDLMPAVQRLKEYMFDSCADQFAEPIAVPTFSKEIEDEANSHFQLVYNSKRSVEDFIATLLQFKTSLTQKTRDVYVCMIRNLVEEYRFFNQYPDAELTTTGMLVGQIIQSRILDDNLYQQYAYMRLVLDALRDGPKAKLFRCFGVVALGRFKERLKDWPIFCSNICKLPTALSLPGEIQAICQQTMAQLMQPIPPMQQLTQLQQLHLPSAGASAPTASAAPGGAVGPGLSISAGVNPGLQSSMLGVMGVGGNVGGMMSANEGLSELPSGPSIPHPSAVAVSQSEEVNPERSLSMGTGNNILLVHLENSEINPPTERVIENVHFIFNNLSPANLEGKSVALKRVVDVRLYTWLAQYIVVKRASLEPNLQSLYANFLNVLDVKDIRRAVLAETYGNINILLTSPKIAGAGATQERSLLKNLGAWLGLLTLARNKPILHTDLPVKQLVLSVMDPSSPSLNHIVPFVCKLLTSCTPQSIFRPPNPWVVAILSVLKEVSVAHKLTVKFELELLCKHLNCTPDDIPNTSYFHQQQQQLQHQQQQQLLQQQQQQQQLLQMQMQLAQGQPQFPQFPPFKSGPQPPGARALAPPRSPGGYPPAVHMSVGPAGPLPSSSVDYGQFGGAPGVNIVGPGGPGGPVGPGAPGSVLSSTAATRSLRSGSFPLLTVQPASLQQYIIINKEVVLLQQLPAFEQIVRTSMERALHEIMPPVVERSVQIATTTALRVSTMDFCTDPDDSKLQLASRYMVQHLVGNLANVTAQEPLSVSFSNNLRTQLIQAMSLSPEQKPTQQQMSYIEQAVMFVCQENVDLGCAYVEKMAVEKATYAMDEQIAQEIATRRRHRVIPPGVLAIPAVLRPRATGVDAAQLRLYETYANYPYPSAEHALVDEANSSKNALQTVDRLLMDLDRVTARSPARDLASLPPKSEVLAIIREVHTIISRTQNRSEYVPNLFQRLMSLCFETDPNNVLMLECYCKLMDSLIALHITPKEAVKSYLAVENTERKLNAELVGRLLRHRILDVAEIDAFAVRVLEGARNPRGLTFAESLLRAVLLCDRPIYTMQDFAQTVELLTRVAPLFKREPLNALLDALRTPRRSALTREGVFRALPVRDDPEDPPGLKDRVGFLLEEWVRTHAAQPRNDKLVGLMVQRIMTQSLLGTDELSTRFYRLCTEFCVQSCVFTASEDSHVDYLGIDALSKLLPALNQKFSETVRVQHMSKIIVTVINMVREHASSPSFNQRPYHRMLQVVLTEMGPLEDANMAHLLAVFGSGLHSLNPSLVPAFAFAWFDLFSHRGFLPKILTLRSPKTAIVVQRLFADLFVFLAPHLHAHMVNDAFRVLFQSTLKLFVVIMHDFPEFLVENHLYLCDIIPLSCVQLRNIVLSAYPRNLEMPDPFTPNLKVDKMSDMATCPPMQPGYTAILEHDNLLQDTDQYLRNRTPVSFLISLRARLGASGDPIQGTGKYNVPLLNALVYHVGVRAIDLIKPNNHETVSHGAAMDIFQHLCVDLDFEGRYYLFAAIANHLRFPNAHTHYFSRAILYLYSLDDSNKQNQEQIVRTLLERLMGTRPHPWGVLITFIELMKNRTYNLWEKSFVRSAPEIARVFATLHYNTQARAAQPEEAAAH